MLYIKVEGLGRVQKNLTGYARRIPEAGRRGLWNFTQHLAKRLRENAPKGYTKRMSSPKYTYAKKLNKNEYAIFMPQYTKYLEEGTNPHWIPATWKTVGWANMHFHWYTTPKGKRISPFAQMRYIIHKKGTKPHPFTARTIDFETKKLKKKIEDEINNSIKRTAR